MPLFSGGSDTDDSSPAQSPAATALSWVSGLFSGCFPASPSREGYTPLREDKPYTNADAYRDLKPALAALTVMHHLPGYQDYIRDKTQEERYERAPYALLEWMNFAPADNLLRKFYAWPEDELTTFLEARPMLEGTKRALPTAESMLRMGLREGWFEDRNALKEADVQAQKAANMPPDVTVQRNSEPDLIENAGLASHGYSFTCKEDIEKACAGLRRFNDKAGISPATQIPYRITQEKLPEHLREKAKEALTYVSKGLMDSSISSAQLSNTFQDLSSYLEKLHNLPQPPEQHTSLTPPEPAYKMRYNSASALRDMSGFATWCDKLLEKLRQDPRNTFKGIFLEVAGDYNNSDWRKKEDLEDFIAMGIYSSKKLQFFLKTAAAKCRAAGFDTKEGERWPPPEKQAEQGTHTKRETMKYAEKYADPGAVVMR